MTTSKDFSKTVSTQEESTSIQNGYVVIVKAIKPRPASSGKSTLLASTGGAESFVYDGKNVQVNLNVYVPIKK